MLTDLIDLSQAQRRNILKAQFAFSSLTLSVRVGSFRTSNESKSIIASSEVTAAPERVDHHPNSYMYPVPPNCATRQFEIEIVGKAAGEKIVTQVATSTKGEVQGAAEGPFEVDVSNGHTTGFGVSVFMSEVGSASGVVDV